MNAENLAAMSSLHAPAAAALAMDSRVRTEIAAQLRARADWLRKEYLAGGSFVHLREREEECRHLANTIEAGRIVT